MKLQCPAKLNLALSVGAPRRGRLIAPATGSGEYHPITSWMVTVNLFDDLAVEPGEGDSTFDIAWADDAPQRSPIDWPVEKDLIYRGHQLIEQHVGRRLPVKVTLRKRIPVGAGMAGGSTDGAGMLKAVNEVFDLRLPRQTLIDFAMRLGSDLAFFFTSGGALVTGRGEGLEPQPGRAMSLVLVLPPLHCPTGAVYRKFDELSPDARVDEQAVREVIAGRREPFNDLAAAAMAVEPKLALLRDNLQKKLGRTLHITGSGAAMFVVAKNAADAAGLAGRITEVAVRVARTGDRQAASGPGSSGSRQAE
ncbi:MAG: 4-(cytidine 5'-diphospho)-2-C-methyl-D-erythritol kinase [Phycisphaerales bacterium]